MPLSLSSSSDLPVIPGRSLLQAGRSDVADDADVCVIGSGCGGASLACRLAERGLRVVVVEQGGYYAKEDFDQREVHMFAKIDGGRGLDTSVDGGASLTYGNNVGGASVHYWADSYRTPPDRLAVWEQSYGLQRHDLATLTPHFEQIERDLNVHVADDSYANAMNLKMRAGAEQLGWSVARVPQARRGCVRSGHCMQGCAYDAKQSQLVTYLPRALAAGARVYSDVRALSLEGAPGLVGTSRALRCAVIDRASGEATATRVTITAKIFVVAAGGYATPDFLLRQEGLKARLPQLGENFFCNPCAQAHAYFDEDMIQWRNIPACWGVDHFRVAREESGGRYVEGGYLLMPNQLQPATLAACLLVDGARQREIMGNYKKMGGAIAWIDDAVTGRVYLDGERRRVSVPLDGKNGERLRDAFKKEARILFATGATEVFFGDVDDTRLTAANASPDQIDAAVARLDLRPARNVFAVPHPGGAARMGADSSSSVVGFDHRVHGSDNVYVSDPSVFPSPPSVDPSLSIMAFSFVCADGIAAKLG